MKYPGRWRKVSLTLILVGLAVLRPVAVSAQVGPPRVRLRLITDTLTVDTPPALRPGGLR